MDWIMRSLFNESALLTELAVNFATLWPRSNCTIRLLVHYLSELVFP